MFYNTNSKIIIKRYSEKFLYAFVRHAPVWISLGFARFLRKALMKESFFEASKFMNYFEYKSFVSTTISLAEDKLEKRSTADIHSIDLMEAKNLGLINRKVLFVCCDGNQRNLRKVPSTFLDVWRDSSLNAGLVSRVCI